MASNDSASRSVSSRAARAVGSAAARTPAINSPTVMTDTRMDSGRMEPSSRPRSFAMNTLVSTRASVMAKAGHLSCRGRGGGGRRRRPRSALACSNRRRNSARGIARRRYPIGSSDATGRPSTVIVMDSPASTRRQQRPGVVAQFPSMRHPPCDERSTCATARRGRGVATLHLDGKDPAPQRRLRAPRLLAGDDAGRCRIGPGAPLPDATDVVVIGGGYAGINAARELARAGRR